MDKVQTVPKRRVMMADVVAKAGVVEKHTKTHINVFGCTLQYMVFTNRLKIEIHKGSDYQNGLNEEKTFYVKLWMTPSKEKISRDKTLTVKNSSRIIDRGYCYNIREHELRNKTLHIQIYWRRGIFRKYVVDNWSVDLNIVDSYDPHTVWKTAE